MQAHRDTTKENKQKFLGKEVQVLVDKKLGEHLYESRDENYNIVLVKTSKENLGKEISVKIKEIGVHHMISEHLAF